MSHRLEKETDTKYHDYSEPKTSRRRSSKEYKKRQENSRSDAQSEDTESIWNIARKSESNTSKGSFGDEQMSVENIKKQSRRTLGSPVASDVREDRLTEETMPKSISNPKEERK